MEPCPAEAVELETGQEGGQSSLCLSSTSLLLSKEAKSGICKCSGNKFLPLMIPQLVVVLGRGSIKQLSDNTIISVLDSHNYLMVYIISKFA